MRIKTSLKTGFTLVEIMIVVAIIGLLAAIAIPNFVKARSVAQKNACINNLRQIDSAKEQWAVENKKAAYTTVPWTSIVGSNGYIKTTPTCPAGGSYTVNGVSERPTCDSVSADHTLP